MTGGSPTLANGFGILIRATPAGAIEDCQISGVCPAKVNVTDMDHRYAIVQASTYVLQSAAIGPVKILYKPSTGTVMCAVNLIGMVGEILVKNESGGDYAANSGFHDYHVYSWASGTLADTGAILSARNIPIFKSGKMGAASVMEGVAFACPWEN
jgi:hypothetical protein